MSSESKNLNSIQNEDLDLNEDLNENDDLDLNENDDLDLNENLDLDLNENLDLDLNENEDLDLDLNENKNYKTKINNSLKSFSNEIINLNTINQYVVFINPRTENIYYLPKIFKHTFNYDYGKLIDLDNYESGKINLTLSDKSLQVYLSLRINPNIFKYEFNKIDYLQDINDIDLILEIIIENGIIRKSLRCINIESIMKQYEPNLIVHADKSIDKNFSNVHRYKIIDIYDLSTLHLSNNIKIQLSNDVFEIDNVNIKTLNELYIVLHKYYVDIINGKNSEFLKLNGIDTELINLLNIDYYIHDDIKLLNSKIEWSINNTIYIKNIESLFDIKELLNDIENVINHLHENN